MIQHSTRTKTIYSNDFVYARQRRFLWQLEYLGQNLLSTTSSTDHHREDSRSLCKVCCEMKGRCGRVSLGDLGANSCKETLDAADLPRADCAAHCRRRGSKQ